jgi:hypothetical protein
MKNSLSNFKFILRSSRILVVIYLMISSMGLWSCKENITAPDPVRVTGLCGIVYDTDCRSLDSVKVYCQYQLNYYSISPSIKEEKIVSDSNTPLTKIATTETFVFALEQNFPNPVQNSTYLRFYVKIAIIDRFDGKEKYSYCASLLEGMYQLYINNLVGSLMLHNGPYSYNINVTGNNGAHYNTSKEMFIISDSSSPNIITRTDGQFVFDYQHAFVGDSVMINGGDLYSTYTMFLGNTITLLFERNGYVSQSLNVELNSNVLFHQDIIMKRRN